MASRIVPATGGLLEQILDETYPLWNEGLSRQDYARFNAAQLRTAWGATHLQRVALVSPAGVLLSTAKRYDLRARLDGRPVRVLGIGAVFTPPSLRRRGLAGELMERLLDAGRQEGFDLALLFSAIGPDYYRRFGFETVPVEQVSLGVRFGRGPQRGSRVGVPEPGCPAMLVRAGSDADVPFLAEMHEARAAASAWRFALDRDPDFIRYSIARKRLLAGFGPPALRQVEYFVADEGDRPAAYAILLHSNGACVLSECGDRDPSGARLGALLQALFARTPAELRQPIRAWLPPGFHLPQLELLQTEPSAVTMMMRPLGEEGKVDRPLAAEKVMYWLGDVV